jgi:hypothetical protein
VLEVVPDRGRLEGPGTMRAEVGDINIWDMIHHLKRSLTIHSCQLKWITRPSLNRIQTIKVQMITSLI